MTQAHPLTQPQTSAHPALQYTGTLVSDAQVRTKVLPGDGHTVPVLCLSVELHNDWCTRMTLEQPFPAGCHDLCQATARKHKAGGQITFDVQMDALELRAHHVGYSHPLPAADAPVAAAVADLFA